MPPRDGLEIERKWLLARAPSAAWLRAHGAVAKRIEQVYLRPAGSRGTEGVSGTEGSTSIDSSTGRQGCAGAANRTSGADPAHDEPGGRRVRRIETDGLIEHVETRKRRLGGFTRAEVEQPIAPDEYERSLADAEPSRQPIRKTRWVFPYAGHELELDVFESPPDVVMLEIELGSEDEPVELPPELAVVREVTHEPAYLNWNLARRA